MSEGKCIAQAGHAYTDTLLAHLQTDHGRAYAALRPGTKISLAGGSEDDLLYLAERLTLAGIPHVTITDRDHVELPDFDGSPVLTALGVGPIPRALAPRFLSKIKRYGDHRVTKPP